MRNWKWSAVTTAEMQHPPCHCAKICCLVSINIQQVLMNVNGCNVYYMVEFSGTPLLHVYFYVTLPLCCHLFHGLKKKKKEYWHESSTSMSIPLISASDVVRQHNKIGSSLLSNVVVGLWSSFLWTVSSILSLQM